MKIFAICLVKNEVDILERIINDALKWADKIIIADHQSTDGTWELINEKLSKIPNVIIFGQLSMNFNDDIRGYIYREYEYLAKSGDWWCRLDSDEVYIDNPKKFLKNISNKYNSVRAAKFQYYFTDKDVVNYSVNPDKYTLGNCVDNLKYYVCNESETRFFRHLGLGWDLGNIWPNTKWPQLIFKKAYQVEALSISLPGANTKRLDVRNKVRSESNIFSHEVRADWNKRISNKSKINVDNTNLKFNQTWQDRVMDHNDLFYDDGVNYAVTTDLMTARIRPVYQQLLRSTLFYIAGKSRNITTR